MERLLNIYKVLEIIREDQRRFDRTVADLKREKGSISFLGANSRFNSNTQTMKGTWTFENCAQHGNRVKQMTRH